MICVSILCFAPMMQVVFVSGLIAIFQPDKLSPSQLAVFIGESFVISYALTVPGTALLIFGYYLLEKINHTAIR